VNVIVPLIVASALLSAPVLKNQTVSSDFPASAQAVTLIADLPYDPYAPGPYGGNPRGPNPHGSDPHDEYHDPNLPSNRDEEDRKAQNKPAQPAP
jgi:hypothetical protein